MSTTFGDAQDLLAQPGERRMTRDERLAEAGVRIPCRPEEERVEFAGRKRPEWVAAILRIIS